jgi:hypothetical protein
MTFSNEFYALRSLYYLPTVIIHGETTQEFYVHLRETPKQISVYGDLKNPLVVKEAEDIYHTLQDRCPPSFSDKAAFSGDHRVWGFVRKALFEASQVQPSPRFLTICGIELNVEFSRMQEIQWDIRAIEVYSHYRERCPQTVARLFDQLSSYRHPRAEPWLPERIEVILQQETDDPQAGEWPTNWPDLHDPLTRKWGTEWGGEWYSLFFDADQLDELEHFLGTKGQLVTLNGKTWLVSWRLPFPGEEAWQHGWAPVKFPSDNK